MSKGKRKAYPCYLNDDEKRILKDMVSITGGTVASAMRKCALYVASDPALTIEVFNDNIKKNIRDPEVLAIQRKIVFDVLNNIELIESIGLEIPRMTRAIKNGTN